MKKIFSTDDSTDTYKEDELICISFLNMILIVLTSGLSVTFATFAFAGSDAPEGYAILGFCFPNEPAAEAYRASEGLPQSYVVNA